MKKNNFYSLLLKGKLRGLYILIIWALVKNIDNGRDLPWSVWRVVFCIIDSVGAWNCSQIHLFRIALKLQNVPKCMTNFFF